eukprot:tig00021073_g18047.t1
MPPATLKSTKCYSTPDCSGSTTKTSTESGSKAESVCGSGDASGKDYGTNSATCKILALQCFSTADCSGAPTVKTEFDYYQEKGVDANAAMARCPAGTLAYKDVGTSACKAAHQPLQCFKDKACATTATNTAFATYKPSACPTGSIAYKEAGGKCKPHQPFKCFTEPGCKGTETSAFIQNGCTRINSASFIDQSTDGAVCQERAACFTTSDCTGDAVYRSATSKCPESAKSFKEPGASECTPVKEVECFAGPGCAGDATPASCSSKCPAETASWKDATNEGAKCNERAQCFDDAFDCSGEPRYVDGDADDCGRDAKSFKASSDAKCEAIKPVTCFKLPGCEGDATRVDFSWECNTKMASFRDDAAANPTCTNRTAYHREVECTDEPYYTEEFYGQSAPEGFRAIVQGGDDECEAVVPACYISSDCSGEASYGSVGSDGAECPAGTGSMKMAGEDVCVAPLKCYESYDCSGEGEAGTTMDPETACNAGNKYFSVSTADGGCFRRMPVCFEEEDCKGDAEKPSFFANAKGDGVCGDDTKSYFSKGLTESPACKVYSGMEGFDVSDDDEEADARLDQEAQQVEEAPEAEAAHVYDDAYESYEELAIAVPDAALALDVHDVDA